jgi:hypothetical protein
LSHPELVENLRDDDVRWNATAAGRELSRRLRDPLQSGEARLHLERALFSDDGQEKRIAVGLLQSLALDSNPALEPYTPPEVLLDYTANQLQGWDCWTQPAWIPGDTHDRKSVDFAFAHIDRMEQRLVEKLASRPPEERFIFAFILGCSERRHLVDQIAPVLIDHLRDNYIRADALMSMQALYALGDVTLPWLHGGVSGADAQQRDCLELLVLELVDPALTPEQRAERARLNRVTRKCDDPVQSWRYRQYRSD